MSQEAEEAPNLGTWLLHRARNRTTRITGECAIEATTEYNRRFHVRYFFKKLFARSKYVIWTPPILLGVVILYVLYRILHHFFFGTYLMTIFDAIVNEIGRSSTHFPALFVVAVFIAFVLWVLYAVRAYVGSYYGWRKSRATLTGSTAHFYEPSSWFLGLEGKNQSFESNVIQGAELTRDDIDNFPYFGTSATVTLLTTDMNGGRIGLFQVIASKPDKLVEAANEIAKQNREAA